MKYLLRPDKDRWHKQDSMKKSAYAFVPFQTNFGELCGMADDVVFPGKGFGMHPHENMEISTIVISGAQAHKDNTGSEGIFAGNSVQTMSAGTGIMHSEFNASDSESFHSFQIWVYPKVKDVKPHHEKFTYEPEEKLNKILLALSPDGRKGTALINQDAFFSVSKLQSRKTIEYKMNKTDNGVYIHCANGSVQVDDYVLNAGDAIGAYDGERVIISANADADLIFVEVPMQHGINV